MPLTEWPSYRNIHLISALIVKEMNKLMHRNDGDQEDGDEESVFSTITSSIGASLGRSICKNLEGSSLLLVVGHLNDSCR